MINVEIKGLEELRARVATIQERTRNLAPPLLRSGLVVLKAAADRIDSGGPGWAPNVSGTPLLHQTGRLLSSLTVGADGNVDDQSGNSIKVGTNVRYAAWLQYGTGIYGPEGQRITPKTASAMVFTIGGRKVFASSTAGSPQRPFLYVDDAVAEKVREVFATYILGSDAVALDG